MDKAEAEKFLLEALEKSIIDGINFTAMCRVFPSETRPQAVDALRIVGFDEASDILKSVTGHYPRKGLWS